MLHISICDDHAPTASKMEQLIQGELTRLGVTADIQIYKNGEDLLRHYQMHDDEFLFIDIDMPVESGIDVVKQFEEWDRNRNVVLISGQDRLILDSLTYAPFQIIQKKNMEKDIPLALQRYFKEKGENDPIIEFKSNNTVYHIKESEILYFEKYRQYIIIHSKNHAEIKIRGSLQEVEKEFCKPDFVRIHAGYLVNLRHCYSIHKNDIVLADGTQLPISRERRNLVKDQFMQFRKE